MENEEYTKQCVEAYQETIKAMKPIMDKLMFTNSEISILENLIQHEVTFFKKNELQGFDRELINHSVLLSKIISLRKEN